MTHAPLLERIYGRGNCTTLEGLLRPATRPGGVELFAIDPDSVQIVWSGGHDELVVDLDRRRFRFATGAAPGAATIDGLHPASAHTLSINSRGGLIHRSEFMTPPAPGQELFRFATVSDLHLGRGDVEYRGPLGYIFGGKELRPNQVGIHPTTQLDIARAALEEASAWGAQHLVVKGDLCDQTLEWTWDQAADLLDLLQIPVSIVPGNHDTGELRRMEPEAAAAARGFKVTRGVEHVDLPGLRLLLVDSTVPGTSWGTLAPHAAEAAERAAEARRAGLGVFVATHHHPQRLSFPLYWPQGIPGPDARRFTRAIHAASPDVLISSGHTHRCRHRSVTGVQWSEVAATSQFPGVWAGYVVYENGIRQTVRRISDPTAMAKIDSGRDLLNGIWALWSTGELSDRCFTTRWSRA